MPEGIKPFRVKEGSQLETRQTMQHLSAAIVQAREDIDWTVRIKDVGEGGGTFYVNYQELFIMHSDYRREGTYIDVHLPTPTADRSGQGCAVKWEGVNPRLIRVHGMDYGDVTHFYPPEGQDWGEMMVVTFANSARPPVLGEQFAPVSTWVAIDLWFGFNIS